ncbi:unnamed protein product [Urochloa humidicola]
MKGTSAFSLILCLATLVLIILLTTHVEPVEAGSRPLLPPPSPQPHSPAKGSSGKPPSSPPHTRRSVQPPAAFNNLHLARRNPVPPT